ncbi:MAG TPA: hypothetical protein CFH82_01710 [Sulfurospirillum sp. UBA12182]|jgi:hypothetical protein|nr:MAG TPA: hypothetical protein CFH82_01710 [Sulfurospirillum sp. UBA12182]
MLTYKPNELMSSTDIAKNFGSVLAKLANHEVQKIGVLKNNKLDFVILRNDEIDNLVSQEIERLKFEENKKIVAEQVKKLKNNEATFYSLEELEKHLDGSR